MTRVVLDTNILVSALPSARGQESRVFELARAGKLVPRVSPAMPAEYLEMEFACAAAARADFIVTGNRRHYPEARHDTAAVVSARDLLGRLTA